VPWLIYFMPRAGAKRLHEFCVGMVATGTLARDGTTNIGPIVDEGSGDTFRFMHLIFVGPFHIYTGYGEVGAPGAIPHSPGESALHSTHQSPMFGDNKPVISDLILAGSCSRETLLIMRGILMPLVVPFLGSLSGPQFIKYVY
jgi:hypothetical protein